MPSTSQSSETPMPDRPTFGARLKWAIRLLCPQCGEGKLFAGWWTMHERCSDCSYVFQREGGYWMGAMYVNYAVAVALSIVLFLILADGLQTPEWVQFAAVVPFALLFTCFFFPISRALWLALDLSCDPPKAADFARLTPTEMRAEDAAREAALGNQET